MADGSRQPIGELVAGDIVLGRNELTGVTGSGEIQRVFVRCGVITRGRRYQPAVAARSLAKRALHVHRRFGTAVTTAPVTAARAGAFRRAMVYR